ncbi:MAG: LptF/LptG family permease [Alphaproteobacteria bacterium]|nr:LptF/LptG family permease [Alphaproteobacteria bacterium]
MRIKPKILTTFLAKRFLASLGLVLLIISGIIFAITFVEKLPREASSLMAANVAFFNLLEYIPLFLPIAVFMGTLLTSYNLTKSSESVIISGAGISPWQKMKPFLITAFIIGIFTTCIVNPYTVKKNAVNINIKNFNLSDNAIWIRESNDDGSFIMRAKGVKQAKDGNVIFSDVFVLLQDANARFLQRVETKKLVLSDGKISTKSATVFGSDGIPTETIDWSHASKATPKNFLEKHLKPDQISFWQLPRMIRNMQQMGLPVRAHLIQFWTLLFLPLTLIAMTTLGTAFSQTRERRNFSFGMKFSMGIMVCFILYFVMNVFSALGASGALPTILAAGLPPLIITTFAAMWIVSFEAI